MCYLLYTPYLLSYGGKFRPQVFCFEFLYSDIDECLASPCDDNAACLNTDGSYECSCAPGFEGDGQTCTGNKTENASLTTCAKSKRLYVFCQISMSVKP